MDNETLLQKLKCCSVWRFQLLTWIYLSVRVRRSCLFSWTYTKISFECQMSVSGDVSPNRDMSMLGVHVKMSVLAENVPVVSNQITLRIVCWYLHRRVSGMGGQEGKYLEDIEGSWPETWRTGSFMMVWRYLVDPKDHILKVLCWYLYGKCVRNGMSRRVILGGCWGFLTRDMTL